MSWVSIVTTDHIQMEVEPTPKSLSPPGIPQTTGNAKHSIHIKMYSGFM